MHRVAGVTCGNLTPDTVMLVGAKHEAVLLDYCSSRAVGQGMVSFFLRYVPGWESYSLHL